MENINFSKICDLKKRIDANLLKLQSTLDDLKKIFLKLNNELNQESSYLGIDSLNFQIKLIEIKIENSKKIYILIKNRLYKEYYKINKNMRKYLETLSDYQIKESNYPIYKDLEPDKEYDFDLVIKIREEMEEFIKYLTRNIEERKKKLIEFRNSENKGLMCNNYIIEEELTISIFEEKLNLYKKHLSTYNIYHSSYLLNIFNEIKSLLNIISSEIKIKVNNENNENKNTENISLQVREKENENEIERNSDSENENFQDIELGNIEVKEKDNKKENFISDEDYKKERVIRMLKDDLKI